MDDLLESPPAPEIKLTRSRVFFFFLKQRYADRSRVYLMVIEGIYERYEPPGLSLLVQSEPGNVPNEDGVKQPGHLQVVTGP